MQYQQSSRWIATLSGRQASGLILKYSDRGIALSGKKRSNEINQNNNLRIKQAG
jgi:hypothetical protein